MDRISQMNKTELRHFFKARRASLNIDEVSQRSRQINQNFIDNLLPKIYKKNSAKIFSLYLSSYNEVSTEVIAQHFSKNGIRFSYPKIVQKNHPLDFILADKLQTLKPNQFFLFRIFRTIFFEYPLLYSCSFVAFSCVNRKSYY